MWTRVLWKGAHWLSVQNTCTASLFVLAILWTIAFGLRNGVTDLSKVKWRRTSVLEIWTYLLSPPWTLFHPLPASQWITLTHSHEDNHDAFSQYLAAAMRHSVMSYRHCLVLSGLKSNVHFFCFFLCADANWILLWRGFGWCHTWYVLVFTSSLSTQPLACFGVCLCCLCAFLEAPKKQC